MLIRVISNFKTLNLTTTLSKYCLCFRFAPLFLLLAVLYHLPLTSSAHGDHGGKWEILKDFSGPFESAWELWVYAISSTALISAAPFFILCCIPIRDASEHSSFLKVLLSFASGGLLGDAFLHLIPHAVSPHDHHHHHDDHEHHHHDDHDHHHHHHDEHHDHAHDHTQDMLVGLWVLAGIVVFLMVEKFVRLAKGGHHHSHGKMERDDSIEERDEARVVPTSGANANIRRRPTGQQQPSISGGGRTSSSNTKAVAKQNQIKVSAYLNLAADFTHNFTDGLAISASYLAGCHIGLITTLTILLHEVPHEIGDFAILIQSGYSKRRAMFVQLVTAIGAMTGTLCGLFAEGIGTAATAWILPFTAGGFIYIATVAVIPELLEDSSVWQSVKEIFAIFVGVGMMVLIAYIE